MRERLGRFELIAELASGGMATVYLARLSGMGGFQRLYAIKRLHPHLARDQEFIQMFVDEARLAARIHHPNVVPILEIGVGEASPALFGEPGADSPYYLVMEYIEGDTLARLFARSAQANTRLPTGVGLRILIDTLAGLHAAHELRDDDGHPFDIVHRDVSPQNIMVGVDGIARITDFGVARASSRLTTTRSGQLKGKLAYMAPEQARAQAVDRRADVFAMGVCLWETLAFRRLFKGEGGDAETLNRVLYEPIPTLQSVLPTIPSSLNAICMKALDRDPNRRFANAAEFADALEQATYGLGIAATSRDVAAAVDTVMGTELTQTREVVRAWLARSEPSRNDSPGPIRLHHESLTKIERGTVASADGSSSGSSQLPPPPSTLALGSLESASDRLSAAERPLRRRRALVWTLALIAVFGGVVLLAWQGPFGWMAVKAGTPRLPPAARTLAPPAPPQVTAPARVEPSPWKALPPDPSSAWSPVGEPSGNAAPAAPSASASSSGPTRFHRRPQRGVSPPAGSAPTAEAPSAAPEPSNVPVTSPPPVVPPPPTVAVPDDITRNPYR